MNRPQVRNAFRPLTVDEMIAAFQDAWEDDDIGVVVLTGAGDKAFSSGGDQKVARQGRLPGRHGAHEAPHHGTARRHPHDPQAGHRRGQRLRHRRRARAARHLRPLAGVGERDIRADGAARGEFRRGVRHGVPRAGCRREEGAGDLVPLPPVLGAGSAGYGAGEQGRAAGAADGGGTGVGGAHPGDEPDGAAVP